MTKQSSKTCKICGGAGFMSFTDQAGEETTGKCGACEGTGLSTAVETGTLAPTYSHERWNALLNDTFDEVRHLAKAKGGEYSGDFDRLKNFRRNGQLLDLPKETIWGVYAAKHWDAIMQYIRDLRTDTKRERMEPITGRIHDLIVYLLLLKAMEDERQD